MDTKRAADVAKLESSVGSPTTSRTLSRKEIYASLASIEKDGKECGLPSRIPKSLAEVSFVRFVADLCAQYSHHSKASSSKGNGSRPVSQLQIENQIQHRSLTLFGGGINQAIVGGKVASKPKRRRLQKKQKSSKLLSKGASASDRVKLLATLKDVNTLWHETLLGACGLGRFDSDTHLGMHELRNLYKAIASFETIGARVRIARCPSLRALVGKEGFVCGDTTSAWHVLVMVRETKAPKLVVVPKRDGRLVVIVRLNHHSDPETPTKEISVILGGATH